MKYFLALVPFICRVLSSPLSTNDAGQIALGDGDALMTSYPGFSLDLDAHRLIQVDGQDPKWTTELGKVRHHSAYSVFNLSNTHA